MVEELQNQLQGIRDQIGQIDRNNPQGAAQYADLKAQESKLVDQIQQAANEAFSVEVATEAQQQIFNQFEQIEIVGETFTLRQLAADEGAYQFLSAWIQDQFGAQAVAIRQENAKAVDALKASYEGDIAELQKQVAQSAEENGKLIQENGQLKLELKDATEKHSAAANELFEAHKEVNRLESQVDDLRKEIALGARGAINVVETNTSGALKEAVEQYKNSRPAIYDLQQLDMLGKRFSAKLAENDETIEFGYLEKGRYRVLEGDELSRFRAELAEQAAQQVTESSEEASADTPLVTVPAPPELPVHQFLEEGVLSGTDSESLRGEVADEAVTLEERVMMLEQSNLTMQTWIDSIEKRVGKLDGQEQMFSGDEDAAA